MEAAPPATGGVLRGDRRLDLHRRYHAAAAAIRPAGVVDDGTRAAYSAGTPAGALASARGCHAHETESRSRRGAAAGAARSAGDAGGGTGLVYSTCLPAETLRYWPWLELRLDNAAPLYWGASHPGRAHSAAWLLEQTERFLVTGFAAFAVG